MNVSKGDLAYVIRAKYPENIGKIVEVHDFDCNANEWKCSSKEKLKCHVDTLGIFIYSRNFWISDSSLRRIAGPCITTEIETEKPIEEMA